MEMENLGLPILLVFSILTAYAQVLKVLMFLHKKRDLILGIAPEAQELNDFQREYLMRRDYRQWGAGVVVSLFVFSGAIFSIPAMANTTFNSKEDWACYLAGTFVVITGLAIAWGGRVEWKELRSHFDDDRSAD